MIRAGWPGQVHGLRDASGWQGPAPRCVCNRGFHVDAEPGPGEGKGADGLPAAAGAAGPETELGGATSESGLGKERACGHRSASGAWTWAREGEDSDPRLCTKEPMTERIKLLGAKGRKMLVRSLGFFACNFFFIEVNQLIYSVTPISAVQNSD